VRQEPDDGGWAATAAGADRGENSRADLHREALTDWRFPPRRYAWRRTYSIPRDRERISEPVGKDHSENKRSIVWYAREDSNLWPLAPEASALSAELRAQTSFEELYPSATADVPIAGLSVPFGRRSGIRRR
jgi:hypothetical protein